MDKEKEFNEMSEIIKRGGYIAYNLQNAGFGNVNMALKNFVDKLKKNVQVNIYNDEFVNKVIDDTLKEFS